MHAEGLRVQGQLKVKVEGKMEGMKGKKERKAKERGLELMLPVSHTKPTGPHFG